MRRRLYTLTAATASVIGAMAALYLLMGKWAGEIGGPPMTREIAGRRTIGFPTGTGRTAEAPSIDGPKRPEGSELEGGSAERPASDIGTSGEGPLSREREEEAGETAPEVSGDPGEGGAGAMDEAVVEAVIELRDLSAEFERIVEGMREAVEEGRTDEFYGLGDEMVETVREAWRLASELQKLFPEDVLIITRRISPPPLHLEDVPLIDLFILVRESLGERIPALKVYLPIKIMTVGGIPEDEGMSFSDLGRISRMRERGGRW